MRKYGNDKPDIRFGIQFHELNDLLQGKDFMVFDKEELVVGISAPTLNSYSRKDIDRLLEWVQRPQIGARGCVWVRVEGDGKFKASADKFYSQEDFAEVAERDRKITRLNSSHVAI